MATAAFEEIAETFEFLDDWEDRYAHVIDMGREMEPLEDAFRVPATKVEGCASQVWLMPSVEDDIFTFKGASDAMIVSGLIAILRALYNGLPVDDVRKVDARAAFERLGLNDHLSAQRSNGLRAMIDRIQLVTASS